MRKVSFIIVPFLFEPLNEKLPIDMLHDIFARLNIHILAICASICRYRYDIHIAQSFCKFFLMSWRKGILDSSLWHTLFHRKVSTLFAVNNEYVDSSVH